VIGIRNMVVEGVRRTLNANAAYRGASC